MLNPVSDALLDRLTAQLPKATFRDLTPTYLEEPRGRFNGRDALLLAPANTGEVAIIVQACNAMKTGIIPYGGGTGLVGGQVAPDVPKPVILSLERMSAIKDVNTVENVLICEAGAILQTIQEAADAANRVFPLTLASQGSARIGGNLSTNAGGVNVLRYGNTRDLCLGLEAVLPTGEVLNGLTPLRKNNTGYDLRHLMIGAEGTLGIITAASLKLFPKPESIGAAMMVVKDPQAALDLLSLASEQLGQQVSAFELIHRQCLDFLNEVGPNLRIPFEQPPEWTVLIDIGTTGGMDASTSLETLFAEAFERGFVTDGVIAQSLGQRNDFWNIRESIPEANRRIGSISSHDISVPITRIPEFIQRGGQALAQLGTFRIGCFGHVGDGNLHYNVFPLQGRNRTEYEDKRDDVKRIVHDLADALEGSVSAEHGIGRLKIDDLNRYGDPAKLLAMRAIKAALDPNGIMNPGAVVG